MTSMNNNPRRQSKKPVDLREATINLKRYREEAKLRETSKLKKSQSLVRSVFNGLKDLEQSEFIAELAGAMRDSKQQFLTVTPYTDEHNALAFSSDGKFKVSYLTPFDGYDYSLYWKSCSERNLLNLYEGLKKAKEGGAFSIKSIKTELVRASNEITKT